MPLLVLCLAAVGLFLLGRGLDLPWLALLAKPWPVLALALHLRGALPGRPRTLVMVGLLLSAVGDVLLEPPLDLFLPGLVAFLLAHLAYIAAFLSWSRRPGLPGLLVFGAWGAGAFLFLRPGLGGMAAPVLAYVLVISTMGWRASALRGVLSPGAAWTVLAGAAAFMVSDTVLATHRFHSPVPLASWIIMSTYWLGQAGIGLGAARALSPSGPRAPA